MIIDIDSDDSPGAVRSGLINHQLTNQVNIGELLIK